MIVFYVDSLSVDSRTDVHKFESGQLIFFLWNDALYAANLIGMFKEGVYLYFMTNYVLIFLKRT